MSTTLPPPEEPKHILVVRLGAMGDVLHALPAVSSLRASFPAARISWLIDPKWACLLEGNHAVDQVIPFDRRKAASVLDTLRILRSDSFDTSFDFQGLLKSAALPFLAKGCQHRWGFHRSALREPAASIFYSGPGFRPTSLHVVDRSIEMIRTAGARTVDLRSPIPPGRADGVLPTTPFILASPFAGWVSKQWPLEYYEELAKLLSPVKLVLNVAPPQLDQIQSLQAVVPHSSTLEGLIYATRQAAGIVGLDSGPTHLAAALAKPGVAIFGPTDPSRNGPYGGSLHVLRQPKAATSYKRDGEISASMRAMRPETVYKQLKERCLKFL
jgi:heptosyltransferase-1